MVIATKPIAQVNPISLGDISVDEFVAEAVARGIFVFDRAGRIGAAEVLHASAAPNHETTGGHCG